MWQLQQDNIWVLDTVLATALDNAQVKENKSFVLSSTKRNKNTNITVRNIQWKLSFENPKDINNEVNHISLHWMLANIEKCANMHISYFFVQLLPIFLANNDGAFNLFIIVVPKLEWTDQTILRQGDVILLPQTLVIFCRRLCTLLGLTGHIFPSIPYWWFILIPCQK